MPQLLILLIDIIASKYPQNPIQSQNMNIQKTWDEVTSIRWKRGNEPVCSTTSCTTGTGTASVFASP
jgi:hypothetical protein